MSDTQIADKDKVRAQELHQKILIHAQLVAQNLWEMCSSLKEMRDSKLYYQLGYMHFDDYCRDELGLKHSQAFKYISIVSNMSQDFVHSSGQIGVTKLALLASISDDEREQLMEQTDVESVTVRELKEQIKGLQAEKQRLETDLSESSEVRETLENSLEVTQRQHSAFVEKSESEKQELTEENKKLAAELEDLKNNPLPEDKYRIAARKHDKDMMEFREQADRDLHDERQKRWDLQEQFDDFRKKQQDIIKDMERQLREAKDRPPAVINMESEEPIFEAYLAMAQEVLNRAFIYATGCTSSRAYLERLDELLLSISSAIDDETGKYAEYDDENGGLTDGKII